MALNHMAYLVAESRVPQGGLGVLVDHDDLFGSGYSVTSYFDTLAHPGVGKSRPEPNPEY